MNTPQHDPLVSRFAKEKASPQHTGHLATMIERHTRDNHQGETAVCGLNLFRQDYPTEPNSYMFTPHLCLVAQGSKHIMLGDEVYVYEPLSYVITSVELPLASYIIKATPELPYLGLTLELDMQEISRLILDSEIATEKASPTNRAIGISKTTPALLNAVERLVGLLDAPNEIALFQPLIMREIYSRLLMDPNQGERLKQIVIAKSRGSRIVKSIDWIKTHYDEPFSVKELAKQAGMSPSGFHEHFRTLTNHTPLQFQKSMRLHEARRLMLAENLDAGNAGFRVGYESPTQFSREYKRMFGNPPQTDIKKLQAI